VPTPKKPSQSRRTVTLEPYFWAAYNEIVKPNRIGWYLATRWLPTLKPLGYAIVGALRARCYYNSKTGELRNEIQVDMEELAHSIGVSRTTLWREFKDNTSLSQFVQRQDRYVVKNKGPQREESVYFVCMDDPIHPLDLEKYEALRAAESSGRNTPPAKVVRHEAPYTLQNETYRASQGAPVFQNETVLFQSETRPFQNGTDTNKESLSLPLGTSLTAVLPPANRRPPEGVETGCPEPLAVAWQEALLLLADQVSKPTFEAHIRTLRPVAVSEDNKVSLAAPSVFTRSWIEKRHVPAIANALSARLGQTVTVCLIEHNSG
jgi:hypothetical protein